MRLIVIQDDELSLPTEVSAHTLQLASLIPCHNRIIDTCVIPILLYGAENWMLTDQLVAKLESFQAEFGKRFLKLSKFTTNEAPLLALL